MRTPKPPIVTWAQIDMPRKDVAQFLTDKNFQPGKFFILRTDLLLGTATIVYVVSEEPVR